MISRAYPGNVWEMPNRCWESFRTARTRALPTRIGEGPLRAAGERQLALPSKTAERWPRRAACGARETAVVSKKKSASQRANMMSELTSCS